MTYDRTAYRWLGVCAVVIAILLLCSIAAFAQFSDVYGDVGMTLSSQGNFYSDDIPVFVTPQSSTLPSVQFGERGLTYIYPGINHEPVVVAPPAPQGQSYIYFGQGGAPDVIVTTNGKVIYQWNGRK